MNPFDASPIRPGRSFFGLIITGALVGLVAPSHAHDFRLGALRVEHP